MYIVNKHDFEVDLVDLTILVVSWIRILSWIWWIVISEQLWSFVAFIVVWSLWTFITILKTCSIVLCFFHTGCCWLHCAHLHIAKLDGFFFQFFINHLATSSATCTVKIVNKNWRQSVVYGSSGGSGGVDGGGGSSDGGSTELHIHRADTRELTAKSSWFCHLLHVSLVGVVAVRTALAPTSNLSCSLEQREPRPQQPSKHTHCAMPWLCSSSLSVPHVSSAWL